MSRPPTSDPSRCSVSLSGGPASYTDEGSGPAVVAVHGLPGSARDFRWLAPHLVGTARLIRVELPGFGNTPVHTQPDPSPLGRARFVLELVRALELERPLLLGHSMGGVVACAAADREPQTFVGLALLSSPGLRRHEMLRRVPFGVLGSLLARPLVAGLLTPLTRRMFALAGFRRYPDSELTRTVVAVGQTSIAEHAVRVRGLQLPTLLAWCDDDPIIEASIAAELAGACPAGPRLHFTRGGHNPQKTHAAEIGEAIRTWLADLRAV